MKLFLQLQAAKDLLQRYRNLFAHAWQVRGQMPTDALQAHEAEFLPAALSLQETPLSPLPRLAMWLMIAFATCALLWAVFGQIDVVATAQGKIVTSEGSKVIQPFDTAKVKAIHVHDGQQVAAGQVLIEFDATATQADSDRVKSDLAIARLQVARAQALLTALEQNRTPQLAVLPEVKDVARWQDAQRFLLGQYAEYSARASQMDAELVRREAEWRSTNELVHKLEQTVPIARQRAQDFHKLVEQNYMSRHGYLEREQSRIEQEADLANQKSRLKELEAGMHEARSQRTGLVAEVRRQALDSMTDGQQKVAALQQDWLKADNRSQLMQVVSPVAGTVQQLAVHTVGGVVTPAQALMVVVPRDNPLEVEAFIENKDIGFVHAGQRAEVKIESFQYTKYGTIHARVNSVSHDAINDDKRGLIYSTRVRLEKSTMQVDGAEVRLSPGMALAVEIKTGKRRVIEYFLSPLLQAANESLRER